MRANVWIGFFLCILLFISTPVTTIHADIINQSSQLEEYTCEQENYQMIIYHCKGLIYTKEIKWISADCANTIRSRFECINNVIYDDNEKHQKKHDILSAHDPVLGQDLKSTILSNPVQNERGVGLFFSKVTGFFGPCSINLLSVLFAAPFFISRARGISVHISGVYYPSFDFVSFQPVKIKLLGFIGALIVFPFLSIGGYIDGVAIFGSIQEIDESI